MFARFAALKSLSLNRSQYEGGKRMKLALTIIGVLLLLAGIIWIGQGFGLIPGGFMYENPTWIYIGAGTAIVGAGIIYFARSWKK
jgi:hypothetical protein